LNAEPTFGETGAGRVGGVQGYLAHKKTPTPLGPPRIPLGPYRRVLGGCVFM